ncbi:glyoxalase [Salinigranum rubrum]|uniref:Glyoxalase n=1 Tax=Salinigranum rubrum TaxID=755307 RepID=A0A2I8VGL2_9EURY|nr:VOC family protein [Salinigranum rubrum]AUV81065.1 glyoxalase [Salinigranum rubrum]
MTTDSAYSMPASAHPGRIALRVGDVDGLLPFYADVLGFDVDRTGDTTVLSAGGTPLVLLNEDSDAPSRPSDAAGLFHLAIRVPSRAALGDVLSRVDGSSYSLSGASDHLVSEALYLRDPEGNGVEVYRDRPREEWTFEGERVKMDTLPLDLDALGDAATGASADRLPDETDLGHVHLEVSSLGESRAFYVDTLGLNVRTESYPGALFVAAGDYHHHVGSNTWNGRRTPAGDHRGVEWFEFLVPDAAQVDALHDALGRDAAHEADRDGDTLALTDPDGVGVRVRPV